MEQELLNKLLENPFFVKSSKGNLLSVVKKDGKWYAQGNEVKRQSDIDYLEKESEKNVKDIEKTYNRLMDDLEYELWDSGQLSIAEKQILEYLLEKGIITRKEGVAGEHETANGTAKWIYTLKDSIKEEQEDDAQRHRLRNKDKSNATKLAWKRNHSNYMRGVRERERKEMNRSFYDICKEMEEHLTEAQTSRDNIFKDKLAFTFDNIAGGIALSINKDNGTLSISTSLEQGGSGQYGLSNYDDAALKSLFSNIKNDLLNLCQNFDDEIQQIIAKNGLKSTK